MMKRPIVNTIIQMVGKGLMVMISLATTGILTRKLGPEIYGSFTYITAIFLLLDAVADFGTRIIGIREMVKDKKIFGQIVCLRLMMTSVAFIGGLGLIFGYKGFENIRLESLMALSMIWLTSVAGSLEIIFQAEQRMEIKVLMDVLFPGFFLIILFFWKGNVGLLWVFLVYLAARIMSLGMGAISRITYYVLRITYLKIDKKKIKYLWGESWPMGLYLLIFTSYDRAVDSTMIQGFMGIKEVAWYGLSYKIYSNLLQPAYYFVSSIFPLLSSDRKNKKELFKLASTLLILGIIAVIPLIYFLAPMIIRILGGEEFFASVEVLRILLLAMFFSYFGHLSGFTLISLGKQKNMLVIGTAALIVNLVANWFLIPMMGINGAAWATVLTEAVGCTMMTAVLWKLR